MTKAIKCRGLRRLASGEFALRDELLGWRFFQDVEDSLPRELARTPKRLIMTLVGWRKLLLHEMPNSFKTGFMIAFYGISVACRSFHPDSGRTEQAESCRNNLHTLLWDMGFKVGRRAVSKIKHSSPWELQLQLF